MYGGGCLMYKCVYSGATPIERAVHRAAAAAAAGCVAYAIIKKLHVRQTHSTVLPARARDGCHRIIGFAIFKQKFIYIFF